mgnify:CR=1 FL=1
MSEWTEHRVEALKSLHHQGQSASQIAKRLGGVSRSAVLGKLHRLGLLRHRRVNASPLQIDRRLRQRAGIERRTAPIRKSKKLRAVLLDCVAVEPLRVGLMDLGHGMCRWPVNDDRPHLFCGNPWMGEHGPYCAAHKALANVPTLVKRIRPPREHVRSRSLDWLEAA